MPLFQFWKKNKQESTNPEQKKYPLILFDKPEQGQIKPHRLFCGPKDQSATAKARHLMKHILLRNVPKKVCDLDRDCIEISIIQGANSDIVKGVQKVLKLDAATLFSGEGFLDKEMLKIFSLQTKDEEEAMVNAILFLRNQNEKEW